MPLVPDASIVLATPLGETHPAIGPIRDRMQREEWVVPALWWFEVRNGLLVNERRNRITEHETKSFLGDLLRTTITIDRSPDETAVMTLARKHRLTVYDTAYLELALREGLPLATVDMALAEAARREGAPLVG